MLHGEVKQAPGGEHHLGLPLVLLTAMKKGRPVERPFFVVLMLSTRISSQG
jgi:hypothetical protein